RHQIYSCLVTAVELVVAGVAKQDVQGAGIRNGRIYFAAVQRIVAAVAPDAIGPESTLDHVVSLAAVHLVVSVAAIDVRGDVDVGLDCDGVIAQTSLDGELLHLHGRRVEIRGRRVVLESGSRDLAIALYPYDVDHVVVGAWVRVRILDQ